MAAPVRDGAWLEWVASLMGAASRQSLTAMLPPQQFHCLLEELPLHLIPRKEPANGDQTLDYTSLFLNPLCSILPPGQVPAELEARRDLLEGFYLQNHVAWVRDAASGFVQPFWLGAKSASILEQIAASAPAPAALPASLLRTFAEAGILISPGCLERRVTEWKATVERGTQAFRGNNYFPLSRLIHPFHIASLRRYYRNAIRGGSIHLGDHQSARRYVAHNHPVARYFHQQIAGTVSAIVGEPVKPSYVYLASYLSGAELKKHTDREQCEFSVTLCLDFSPEPEGATPWPIRVDTPNGAVKVFQKLGDGLVYRGTRVPHYRDVLAEGQTSTSIFFHYVPLDFSGSLD